MKYSKSNHEKTIIKNESILFIIVWFLIQVFSSHCYPQQLLHKVSGLDIYDDHIHNIYSSDSILYVLRADWDNRNGFSTNIYNIANLSKPYLIGRQHKDTFEGESEFQDRIVFIKDSDFQHPFFTVLSEDGTETIHTFWYPNKVIESDSIFFEFRSFDPEIRIHQALTPTVFQQNQNYSLSISNPVFTGFTLIGDIIYLTTKNCGLVLLYVVDINSIKELPSPIAGENLVRIISDNNKAWIEKDSGEIIELDVSNPRQPEIIRIISDTNFHLTGFWSDDAFYLKGEKNIIILDSNFNLEKIVTLRKPDFVDSFVKKDSTLFVSTNYGVDIYNLADEQCKRLSRIGKSTDEPFHFEKHDNLLYIANTADGLTIIDVTNARMPRLLSNYYLNGTSRDIKISGDYAYIADHVNGLVILDISQPEKPKWVSSLNIYDGVKSIDLHEEILFLSAASDGGSVYAIDISDKSMPELIHRQNLVPTNPWMSWFSNDNILFAGGYIWCYFEDYPLFSLEYNSVNGFIPKAQFGDSPYTGWGFGSEIKAFENLLYFLTESGIRIIDMNTLEYVIEKPGFAGGSLWGPWPQSVALQGDTLFISQSYQVGGGIEAYNMTEPANPIQTEEYLYYDFQSSEIIFEDDYLYMLMPAGIQIYSTQIVLKIDEKNKSHEPGAFYLYQNYPNPFNPQTSFRFSIPNSGRVTLRIFDIQGRQVATIVDADKPAGEYVVTWNGMDRFGNNATTGIYLYQTQFDEHIRTEKMILVK